MFYYVCKAKYLRQNEEVGAETFQVCAETKEAALEKANCHCDKTAKQIICNFKVAAKKLGKKIDTNIIYVFTGEFQEAKFEIVGDNGITVGVIGDNGIKVGPVTEYEANNQKSDLMYEYPEAKFEIKEVI